MTVFIVPNKVRAAKIVDGFIRVRNPEFTKGTEAGEVKSVAIDEAKGIKADFSTSARTITHYYFDQTEWTVDEAKGWVKENSKELAPRGVKAVLQRDVKVKDKKTGKVVKRMLAIASEEDEDRDGEVIAVDGWLLQNFKTNPVVLWYHNQDPARKLPIGKAKAIGVRTIGGKKRLVFEPEFETITEFGRTVVEFIKEGLLNTFSVGFLPRERDGNKFTKQELLEISLVPVPSLAGAQFIERAAELGVKKKIAKSFVEQIELKTVIPYAKTATVETESSWDANKAASRARDFAGGPKKEDIDFEKYKQFFAWHDNGDSKNFASYKLAHHDVVDGRVVVNFKGVAAAMAVLLGARGGIDITETDRKAVYEHLAKHYAQFDREPPAYELVESQELKHIFDSVEEDVKTRKFVSIEQAIKSLRHHIRKNRNKASSGQPVPGNKATNPVQKELVSKIVQSVVEKLSKLST